MGDIETVAVDACRSAGAYLTSRFRDSAIDAEFDTTDVKAAVDREAEKRVLREIRAEFPAHRILAEEDGESGTDDSYTWIVDPLDGTNNFVTGVSVFATAVAVLDADGPLLSVIYEPLPDALYVARRGEGATVNGVRLDATNDVPLEHGTVSLILGLDAVRDDELAARAKRLERALGEECKRVLQTWAPCIDWSLLARGSLEGAVSFHPDVYEQCAGFLLAEESGAATFERGELSIASANEATVERLRSVVLDP